MFQYRHLWLLRTKVSQFIKKTLCAKYWLGGGMSQAIAEAGADIKLLADSVVGQDRQDILNLMLCAELSARKNTTRMSRPVSG